MLPMYNIGLVANAKCSPKEELLHCALVRFQHLSSELNLLQVPLWSQTALTNTNLLNVGIDSAELRSLVVGKLVHCRFRNVHARWSSVDGQHIDALALIRELVALAALIAVPARYRV